LSIDGPDERVAETLRTLVLGGSAVVRFERRGSGLERRYRVAFGGNA